MACARNFPSWFRPEPAPWPRCPAWKTGTASRRVGILDPGGCKNLGFTLYCTATFVVCPIGETPCPASLPTPPTPPWPARSPPGSTPACNAPVPPCAPPPPPPPPPPPGPPPPRPPRPAGGGGVAPGPTGPLLAAAQRRPLTRFE